MYCLYILENKNIDKLYIGTTNNLQRRLTEHNSHQRNRYTEKQTGEWILIFSKTFESKFATRKGELRLKKAKNKTYLRWYINNH